MIHSKILALAVALIATGVGACSEYDLESSGTWNPKVDFTVNSSKVITENFLGFGTQYNNNLFTSLTAASDGVTPENIADLEAKVHALGSQYVRIFFDLKGWSSSDKYNPEYMPSFIRVVELAQRTGAQINITYWNSSKVVDMAAFADVIHDLIVTQGLTNVKQVTIQNEVNSTKITREEYLGLYEAFVARINELGIRDRIRIVGGDLLLDGQAEWFAFMSKSMAHLLDGYSSHIYWDHWDVAKPLDRLTSVAGELAKMTGNGVKPCYITEYGIRGERPSGDPYANPGYIRGTKTPIGWSNLNAFKHAQFHIDALNTGMAGLIKWDCYKAKYDNGNQFFSVIGPGSEGYPLYPSYWMTWLFTHTSKSGWKVVTVDPTVKKGSPKAIAAMTDGQGNFTVYGIHSSNAKVNFKVGGLPADTKFRAIAWNDDLQGALTDLGSLTTDKEGVLSVDLKATGFVALTTLDVTLPENLK